MDYPAGATAAAATSSNSNNAAGAAGAGVGAAAGEVVVVEQRERKLSRGEAGSDSSSKDGSIQSDTSLDSEDSCVSVIFIPHPEGRFGDGSGEAIAAGTRSWKSKSCTRKIYPLLF